MSKPDIITTWNDPMPGIEAATRKGLLEILANVAAEAKSLCPVDKGTLRDSIGWTIDNVSGGFEGDAPKLDTPGEPLTGYVGSAVSYAIYQEAGTRYIPPSPYIRPAIAIHAQGKKAAAVMAKWAKIHNAGKLIPGENREGF